MKAAQISKYGGTDVIQINKDAPKPAISPGKLLIEVHAAGVNAIDWKIRAGYLQQMAPLSFPATLGGDFSGILIESGEGVSGFKRGDEVYGQAIILGGGSGAFAEFVSADAKMTAHKPKNINHVEAAALPLTGVSALQGLIEHIGLSKGKKILIHGGAGGIGTFAIQLAKHMGAYVTTTAKTDDIQYVKNLGADEAIDYEKQSFDNLVHDYDAVFDTVGGETYTRSFKALKKGGTIVSMLVQPLPELMQQYGVNAIGQYTQVNNERLSNLTRLVEQKGIKVHVDKTFPLEKAGEALAYLQEGRVRGKIVIKIK